MIHHSSLYSHRTPYVWALFLATCVLAAAPARAQLTEDQFLNAVMPVLTKVDLGSEAPLSASWLSPEFLRFQLAADKKLALSDALIGEKLIAEALIFILVPLDGKPNPGLKDAAARTVLRLPDGAVLASIRMPSSVEKEFAGDAKKPGGPTLVAFPSRRPDGSPSLPPGAGKMSLELTGRASAKPRVFTWSLPINYPAEATQALQRFTEQQDARVQAFTAPDADVPEAMIAWLAEFATMRGTWLAMAWCPAEWWELNWKTEKKVDEDARTGFRLLFNDLTTFTLMSFERKDAKSLSQWAERCVLIDGDGARYTPVKLPADLQSGFTQEVAKGMKSDDVSVFLVAFKLKLDAGARQPFRIVVEDEKQQPAATFRWQPPLALPARFTEALAAARRP